MYIAHLIIKPTHKKLIMIMLVRTIYMLLYRLHYMIEFQKQTFQYNATNNKGGLIIIQSLWYRGERWDIFLVFCLLFTITGTLSLFVSQILVVHLPVVRESGWYWILSHEVSFRYHDIFSIKTQYLLECQHIHSIHN